MNQANKLREWKRKREGDLFLPVWSVLYTRNCTRHMPALESIVDFLVSEKEKVVLTIEGKGCGMTSVYGPSFRKEQGFFSLFDQGHYEEFIKESRIAHSNGHRFIHLQGQVLDAHAITRSLMCPEWLLLADTSEQGAREVAGLLKVVEAKKITQPISLWVDAKSEKEYNQYINSVKDLSGDRMKYFMEPIGWSSFDGLRVKQQKQIRRSVHFGPFSRKESTPFPDRVHKILFGC